MEKLEEDGPLPSHLLEKKTFIQTEMLRLCEEEEAYWHKRSNMNWLLKGDLNTDYFHRVANGKKRKNHIFSLRQDDKIIESDENILQIATDYFKSLFGPSNSPICKMDPSCWSPEEKVSQEESEQLNSKFSEEEIKNVVFSMEKNTAPGPDHIPVEFFQTCWEIIKQDLMFMFEDFENLSLDIGRLNYGTITLLPKIKEANKKKQYRPICLLNVVYKIFTKTLMLRLEKILERMLNRCQTTFLKGRNIMEGILSLHEILHDTKVKKKRRAHTKTGFRKGL